MDGPATVAPDLWCRVAVRATVGPPVPQDGANENRQVSHSQFSDRHIPHLFINSLDCGVHTKLCPHDIPVQAVWEGGQKGSCYFTRTSCPPSLVPHAYTPTQNTHNEKPQLSHIKPKTLDLLACGTQQTTTHDASKEFGLSLRVQESEGRVV